ncbi:MAG: amino acid adenylation domain-containing protein [Clostridia bacterium]|nr:amino acid adenylation domain-containing protein [Clostridia bacterium]
MNIDKFARISTNARFYHNDAIPEICPLSEAQRGIYFECLNKPESDFYNIVYYCELPDIIDIEHFVYSIQRTIADYPIFDTRIDVIHGVPSMVKMHSEVIPEMVEVECITADSLDEELENIDTVFNLKNGPLYRIELCECGSQYYLLINVHHIISDAVSLQLLVNRIVDNYSGMGSQPEELTQFDVGMFEKSSIPDEDVIREARSFFDYYLGGHDLQTRLIPDVVTDGDYAVKLLKMDASDFFTMADMVDLRASRGLTENAVFQGAFAYSLAVMAGTNSCFYLTAGHGRTDKRLKSAMGMFVQTIPMYIEIDNEMSVDEYLNMIRKRYNDIKENDVISMSEISSRYGVDSSIVFNYVSDILSSAGLTKHINRDETFDINFELNKGENGYFLNVLYRSSLYSESFISNFASLFFIVIKEMLTCRKLADIKLIDDISRSIIDEINMTEMPYRVDETIVSLFRTQTAHNPNKTCLVCGDSWYTYAEVNRITDNLAMYLVTQGVSKESVVSILINRSEYMLICALGVLKAGGAYLPLDPTYPSDRLSLMVKDSGTMLLISEPDLSSLISDDFAGPRLMTEEILSLEDNAEVTLPEPAPEDLFVVIYTSGSTGVPKGVMYEHRNSLVTCEWVKKFYEINENSKVAAYSSYGFDANVFDMYPPLIAGGELHIIKEDMRLDFPAMRRYFNEKGITQVVMPTQVGRQFALMGGLTSLKHLSVAGEKLTPLNPPSGMKMYNLYGPTEGSVVTSFFEIDKYYNNVPIGKPVDNLKIYVTDSLGRLLPCGAVGELLISGPHITRGYLNRPKKTAEVYKENIYDRFPQYERVYVTGDIVRLNEDGNLQFIGRYDQQVKIRGCRVELNEVEEVVRRFPGIADATVAAFEENDGGKFIAAYVVSEDEVDIAALNDFIKSEKPPYMVPAVTMQIDKIPLNRNQKVNKRALPVPVRQKEKEIPTENEMQRRLHDIISEVIGHDEFGIISDLYDVGLNSIGTVKLIVALDDEYHVPFKTTDIRANPTIKMIEAFIKSNSEATVPSSEKKTSYPITDTQAGIFAECLANPEEVTYNIPLLFRFDDEIDIDRLSEAIRDTFDAHYYLKTEFYTDSNGNILARPSSDTAVVDIHKCSALPMKENLVRPFDLFDSPLYRISIYETDAGNYLFIDIHHLICDGTSEVILLNDISKAYAGVKLVPELYSGYEKAEEEFNGKESSDTEISREYWHELLSSCETDCLPKPEPEIDASDEAGRIHIGGDSDFVLLNEFCRNNGFTLNAFFNAVMGYVISEYTGMNAVSHSTIYSGRSDSRYTNSCMMAVRTIPVVSDLSADSNVTDYINTIQNQLMESMSHEGVSFPELASEYKVMADIMLVYQGDNFSFNTFCDHKALIEPIDIPVAKAPISVTVSINGDHFDYEVEYLTRYYSQNFITGLLESFVKAARSFADTDKVSDVSIMSEYSEEIYAKMNDTDMGIVDMAVPNMIKEYASCFPERTAVIVGNESITFRDLVDRALNRAEVLVQKGVGKDVIVGFVLDRSVEVIITELAIMFAGGAFLPLTSDYPDDRIEYCLKDSESPVVITTSAFADKRASLFGEDKAYKTVTVEELYKEGESLQVEDRTIESSSLAYCIYMSDSVGSPKGVMIEHKGFTNVVQTVAVQTEFLVDENDDGSVLALNSLAFDMSILEIYIALCNGKTVCVATEDEIRNPFLLREFIKKNNVRFMVCTTSFAMNLLSIEGMDEIFKNLSGIMVGEEAFNPQLYDSLHEFAPELQILNSYGTTETTQCCAVKELHSSDRITIGRPIGNVKLYVVDRNMNILPPYATGELLICGICVGRGYVNLPVKTSESFINIGGLHAYRSGDIVRMNADGEIDFCGRTDNQIKLRGIRVELDEIENLILSHDSVLQCKVIVRNNGSEDYLAGFYTSDGDVTPEELTKYIKSKLTYNMVPSALIKLDEMPVTDSGKIDIKNLPETSDVSIYSDVCSRSGNIARNAGEKRMCDMFASALGMDEVFVDENFFELGGTPLAAAQLTMSLMSENVDIKYGDIFDNPTPEAMALLIEKKGEEETSSVYDKGNLGTRPALQWNLTQYASEVERESLGNVLLTEATGFIGAHVLKELIDNESGHIYCLARPGVYESSEIHLKTVLTYYFGDDFNKAIADRITVIDGDITDMSLADTIEPLTINTVLNCAACVDFFTADDDIETINVKGVELLIDICVKRDIKLIQVSTVSVPGMHTEDTYARALKMHENELFVIDDMGNDYAKSKYQAELRVFDAIEEKALRAKVIRIGNLIGRCSDGEFRTDRDTNMFISGLHGFCIMGKYPLGHVMDSIRFSPIDYSARAVVLLSGTNDKFTAFNADNRYGFDKMKIIDICKKNGIDLIAEEDDKYYEEFRAQLSENRIDSSLNGISAYDIAGVHEVDTDNSFTTNVLYRLGFSWPLADDSYLDRAVKSLKELGFFEPDGSKED